MFREFLLFSILFFVGITGHRGFQSEFHEEEFQSIGSFIKLILDFARDLNSTEVHEIMKIVENQNLTKAEIRTKIEQWAASQSTELYQTFSNLESEFDALKQNITTYFDERALNLSSAAKNIYDEYKEIYQADDLTIREECEAINNVTESITNSSIKRELYKVFGKLPRCPDFERHHRKHFDNDSRENQGRRFGGFGRGQKSNQGSGRGSSSNGFGNSHGQGFEQGFGRGSSSGSYGSGNGQGFGQESGRGSSSNGFGNGQGQGFGQESGRGSSSGSYGSGNGHGFEQGTGQEFGSDANGSSDTNQRLGRFSRTQNIQYSQNYGF